jgi:hypothetical protein
MLDTHAGMPIVQIRANYIPKGEVQVDTEEEALQFSIYCAVKATICSTEGEDMES